MEPFLLQHLLTNSARRLPHQVAVVDGERTLTYTELDARSSWLAAQLRAADVGVGNRVGIYLNKSLEAVVAIFGILKSGAAYVPLDPDSPVARISMIVEDCQLAALITTSDQAEGLKPKQTVAEQTHWPAQVFCIDTLDFAETIETEVLNRQTSKRDLAYILYTSGSTGKPKGVMIDHRAALTFVKWGVDYFGLTSDDRLSSHAPLHFDLSIFDIFAAIAAGATVALVPAGCAIFPYTLAEWIAQNRITVWYSVPSVLTKLVLHGDLDSHDLSDLRSVLFAGEVFPVQHLRQLQVLLPHPAYYNLYGPTETNVCTVFDVPQILPDQEEPCPIGRSCAYAQTYLCDDAGKLITEPDQIGELYVGGPSLMRGYWGMPHSTSPDATESNATIRVLVPHPFEAQSHDHVYRTGDLVRQNQDGEYIFVGRRDGMIKSRGYRIELGEIEATVYRHPAVAEAVAVPISDDEFTNRLALAVVVRNGVAVSDDELATFCHEHLPAYMVPEFIEQRPMMPKTSTGKTDRLQVRADITCT